MANHPVLHGYVEAKKLFPDSEIRVLSIGTGLSKRSLNGEASNEMGNRRDGLCMTCLD